MTQIDDIHSLRRDYTVQGLSRKDLAANPIEQLQSWLQLAIDAGEPEANAMCLATIDAEGTPNTRVVLLKNLTEQGLTFFTNYQSRKANDIENNSHVAVNFLWLTLHRQVNIKGRAQRISAAETVKYFVTRPLASQLGAWSSPQSQVIKSRQVLESAWETMKNKYAQGEVPVPPHWGGYRIEPSEFEFWQGQTSRLHDRFCYRPQDQGGWAISRLAP